MRKETLPSGLISWRAQIPIAGVRRVRRFSTKDAALQWLNSQARRAELAASGVSATDNPRVTYSLLGDELTAFWSAGLDRVRTPATLASYQLELAEVLAWWGPRRVIATTPSDIDAYVAALRARGLSSSSIRHRLDRLSQMHTLAVRRGYLEAACPIERPRLIQRDEPEAMPESEYSRLISGAMACQDHRVLTAVLLAGDAGLRRAEILRLRATDTRLSGWDGRAYGTIRVASESEEHRTKSGHGRVVPILTERLHDAIRASWPSSPGLILRDAASRERLETLVRRAYREAGMEPRRGQLLHILRHRFGSWLADRGVAPKAIREWMGHRALVTTERYLRRRTEGIPLGAAEPPRHHHSTTDGERE